MNKAPLIKTDNADINDANANIPHYIRSNINRAAQKRASQVLINKMHDEFSRVFFFKNRLF